MGLFDKLKEKSRGIVTAAKPDDGIPALSAEEVRSRLLAISGKGIETGLDGDEVVVSWSAKIASAGPGGGDYEYRYRAIRLGLDEGDHEAEAICFKTSTDAELVGPPRPGDRRRHRRRLDLQAPQDLKAMLTGRKLDR